MPSTPRWELSANWLEFFKDAGDDAARVDRIRGVLRTKGRTLKKSGRLAVLNVGAAKRAVHNALKDDLTHAELRVEHAPEDRDESHVDLLIPAVGHPEQSERASAAIRSVIFPRHVYEAVTSASAGV